MLKTKLYSINDWYGFLTSNDEYVQNKTIYFSNEIYKLRKKKNTRIERRQTNLKVRKIFEYETEWINKKKKKTKNDTKKLTSYCYYCQKNKTIWTNGVACCFSFSLPLHHIPPPLIFFFFLCFHLRSIFSDTYLSNGCKDTKSWTEVDDCVLCVIIQL